MRTLVAIVLTFSTALFVGQIVWFPGSVNGLDFLYYAGLWIFAMVMLRLERRREIRERLE